MSEWVELSPECRRDWRPLAQKLSDAGILYRYNEFDGALEVKRGDYINALRIAERHKREVTHHAR